MVRYYSILLLVTIEGKLEGRGQRGGGAGAGEYSRVPGDIRLAFEAGHARLNN